MAGKTKPKDPPPPMAPLYMVSFGDMITIMLTFFILLCSYSTQRQAGFVADGIGSFKSVLNTAGLPGILPGVRHPVDLGASKVRYKPAEALNYELLETEDGRVNDLNRNALRDVVKKSLAEDDVTQIPVVFVFDFQETALSAEHKAILDELAPLIVGSRSIVRIEGFAYEEELSERETRKIAVRRAHAIADRLIDEHGISRSRVKILGHGSSGKGVEKRRYRRVQDWLGRRIATLYLVSTER